MIEKEIYESNNQTRKRKNSESKKKKNQPMMNINPRLKRQGSFTDLDGASKKTRDDRSDEDISYDEESLDESIDGAHETADTKQNNCQQQKQERIQQQHKPQQQNESMVEKPKRRYAKRKNPLTSNHDESADVESKKNKRLRPQSIKDQKRMLEEAEKAEIMNNVRNEGEFFDDIEIQAEVNRRLRIKNMERKNNVPLYILTNKNKTQNIRLDQSPCDKSINENENKIMMLTKNGLERSELNHELELKYNRNKYTVIIHGNNIEEYSTNIFDRLDELKRCVGVVNPLLILPFIDKVTEVMSLKVTVNNYQDYLKIIGKWPLNAFKSGVSIEPLPHNLTVIISNVDKDLNLNNDKQIKHIEKIYGLMNLNN
ncbi:unnamed protein product [Brachionus calyciflorus]|uniref:Uncharacterized protein n=1 Tax=Brachionus calyciflorus TaxID=104777 RepID=A0A814HJJ4_9BILA|nr:unnamed protein product [Brachionus calyciflorus]